MANDDCDTCKEKECSTECFNSHVGSIPALKKVLEKDAQKRNIKILLVTG